MNSHDSSVRDLINGLNEDESVDHESLAATREEVKHNEDDDKASETNSISEAVIQRRIRLHEEDLKKLEEEVLFENVDIHGNVISSGSSEDESDMVDLNNPEKDAERLEMKL